MRLSNSFICCNNTSLSSLLVLLDDLFNPRPVSLEHGEGTGKLPLGGTWKLPLGEGTGKIPLG